MQPSSHDLEEMIGFITRTWPFAKLTDGQIQDWRVYLADKDHDRAVDAWLALRDSSKFMPTFNEFITVYRSTRQEAPTEATAQVPKTATEKANVAKLVKIMRAALVDSNGKHLHGGLKPCPVCGGINPHIGAVHAP